MHLSSLRRAALSFLCVLLAGAGARVGAQNLMPNPSLENGSAGGPSNWYVTPSYATNKAAWVSNDAYLGTRSAYIIGTVNDFVGWANYDCPAQYSTPYFVRFRAQGPATNLSAGFTVAGFTSASRDFARPGGEWLGWTDFSYIAWLPPGWGTTFQMGAFNFYGGAWLDDAEVYPVQAFHRQVGPYVLGEGESLTNGRYAYQSRFEGHSGNYSRHLVTANTRFNSFKWYLDSGSRVTYRHALPGLLFSNALVNPTIQNYNSLSNGTVRLEASTNGTTWVVVGDMQGTNTPNFTVPGSLFPAAELYLRFGSTNPVYQGFGFTGYSIAADVSDTTTSGTGESHFAGIVQSATNVQFLALNTYPTGKLATVAIANTGAVAQSFTVTARTTFSRTVRERSATTVVAPGATNQVSVAFPVVNIGENNCQLLVSLTNGSVVAQRTFRQLGSILTDDSYGESFPAITNLPVWWCGSTFKVGRHRAPPLATNAAVRLSAARNEYEPFQIVLRPDATLSNLTVTPGNFISLTNPAVSIAATNVTVDRVEYVPVTALDREIYSTLGDHPDPLVPVTNAFDLPGGTNAPLWVTVYVPKDAPAGDYDGQVTFQSGALTFNVPVRLHVFDFALTDVTHTGTAYGIAPMEAWHGLPSVTGPQQIQVWELYMQFMAKHRASPYFPQWYAPINYSYNAASNTFTYDFAAFDEAMERFLEEYNFNSYHDLNYTFTLPAITGYPALNGAGTAINDTYRQRYPKLMQPIYQHLRERGWFDKLFSAWIDEPQPDRYPLVRDGMLMYEDAEPDAPRVLPIIVGPDPTLFGYVNAWMPNWTAGHQGQYIEPRKAVGDRMWYYVATGPKAPFPNNFIDHPGMNHRVRNWFTKRAGFEGEDCWSVNAYLGNPNPWLDAMSSTYLTNGTRFLWGNGDGALIYPPVKEKPTNSVVLSGPIGSLRLAIIRDSYEDLEYFWLLERLVSNSIPVLGTNHPAIVEAQAAMSAGLAPWNWPPMYPFDIEVLQAARQRIAGAIETLDHGAPFIAKDPLSKVVLAGANQTLRTEAAGWPVPALQWQCNGTNLPGATAARLMLSNLTATADYRVIASNAAGSATSAVGRVTVLTSNLLPIVIKSPTSLTRTNGERAVFGAGISSLTPLTYQWLFNGAPVAGATNVTLTRTNLSPADAGGYALVASNAFGVVTSAVGVLTLQTPGNLLPPAISASPTNSTFLLGQTAQFSVTATGTAPLTYQWYFNTNTALTGATNSLLQLTNVQLSQVGAYRVIVANAGGSATSAVAVLTVQAVAPFITTAPTNLTVIQGQGAQFNVAAGGSLPLAYQWFFNDTNLLAGANTSQLLLTNVQPVNVGSYVVRITNIVGAATSAPVTLALQGMPNYTNEPPGLVAERQTSNLLLRLAPDNRLRTIVVSSNLVDWADYQTASPSSAETTILISSTNASAQFFRLRVVP